MSPVTVNDLERDERWQLVTRVVASSNFEKAAQLRELLLFLSERAIMLPSEALSEQETERSTLPEYLKNAKEIADSLSVSPRSIPKVHGSRLSYGRLKTHRSDPPLASSLKSGKNSAGTLA